MEIYDTLKIGCSYFSVGFALKKRNVIICEENQICDNRFYLPLRSYKYSPYFPSTEEGKKLLDIFSSLNLIQGDFQNINGFECGFCKFLLEEKAEILLKCRVIKTEKENGIYKVTVHTNEGLSFIYAKSVLNTLNKGNNKFFTLLFTTDNIKEVSEKLICTFSGAYIEPAFYEKRYALYIPVSASDENEVKLNIYQKWRNLNINAKIIYMAPVFSTEYDGKTLCDEKFSNPVEALEAGLSEGAK